MREAVEDGPKVVTMGTLRWYAEQDSPRRYDFFFSTRRKAATDTPYKAVSEVSICSFERLTKGMCHIIYLALCIAIYIYTCTISHVGCRRGVPASGDCARGRGCRCLRCKSHSLSPVLNPLINAICMAR